MQGALLLCYQILGGDKNSCMENVCNYKNSIDSEKRIAYNP